jgi:predicted AAA+ superfamily ATPase
MPKKWIYRTLQECLTPSSPLGLFPIWLVLGPRQVGKTSLLRHCSAADRRYISLDDLPTRRRATESPELFTQDITLPVLIDEIQYAPHILSHLKLLVDKEATPPGCVWLTGSQNFQVMRGVRESLAGRVGIVNLLGLSDQEKVITPDHVRGYFEHIFETSFPRLFKESNSDNRALFINSYLQTYVERDIQELLGVQKRREFEVFLKMCALRTAQIVNYDDLARDVGVSASTIKEWLSVLEDSFLIKLIHPFHSNKTKRLIKSPKLYFLDMGLAAYLGGWLTVDSLLYGPMAGAAFETHIFATMLRYCLHRARPAEIHFWRTRDGQEVDFIVSTARGITPVEVKLGLPSPKELLSRAYFAESSWREGRVITAACLGSPALIGSRMSEGWLIGSPLQFDFLD